MSFPNLQGKTFANADSALDQEAAFIAQRALTVHGDQRGTLPFVKTGGTNESKHAFAMLQGNFCQNATEINDAKSRVVSFKDVFDSWKRYSHQVNTAPPALPAELNGWTYTEAGDYITSNINSSSHIGLVSRDTYSDWELEVELSAIGDGDDDSIGVVLGFYTDPQGVEQSLTIWRGCGGNGFTWRAFLNYVNARSGLTSTVTFGTAQGSLVKWGNGGLGANATEAGYTANANGGWNGVGKTKVKVTRVGDVITCRTTDFELFDPTLAYIPAADIVIDLAAQPSTSIFQGKSAYGYCAYSQNKAKYTVLNFTGGERVIYDVVNNQTHVDSGSGWAIDASRSLAGDLGTGRMLFNRFTGKIFYIEAPGEVYHLNGVAMPTPP